MDNSSINLEDSLSLYSEDPVTFSVSTIKVNMKKGIVEVSMLGASPLLYTLFLMFDYSNLKIKDLQNYNINLTKDVEDQLKALGYE